VVIEMCFKLIKEMKDVTFAVVTRKAVEGEGLGRGLWRLCRYWRRGRGRERDNMRCGGHRIVSDWRWHIVGGCRNVHN